MGLVHAGADSEISFLSGSASGECVSPTSYGYGNTGSGYQSSLMIMPGETFEFDGSWDGAAAAFDY